VVYADNDPIVNVHANALLTDQGSTGIVLADLRDPKAILSHPVTRRLIDFDEPVALLLFAVLHFIRDEENPREIVATLRDALPAGSYLALSHVTGDFRSSATSAVANVYNKATSTASFRSHNQIAAFFKGWELVEPGLVQGPVWRPDGDLPKNMDKIWLYGGVARIDK
jgi:hypothetical protein